MRINKFKEIHCFDLFVIAEKANSLCRLLIASVFIYACCWMDSGWAESYRLRMLKDIHIEDAWARASIGHAKSGAAYISVLNNGKRIDKLTGISTYLSKNASFHITKIENGIAKMRAVKDILLYPGQRIIMKPGGIHIMLMGIETPLKEGKYFYLTLIFERAGSIEVPVMVKKGTSMGHD